MNTQEFFWIIAIIALLIIVSLVIAALYYLYRFIKLLKQEVKGIFDSKAIKEIIESITGKGSLASEDQVIANAEQFLEGYIIGLQEYLQKTFEYFDLQREGNRIALFIEMANQLDEVKQQGEFFLSMPGEDGKCKVLFQESEQKEQQNDARD